MYMYKGIEWECNKGERGKNLVREIKGENLIKGEWECFNINKSYKKRRENEKSRRAETRT
jgi:hypothetical protein